MLVRPDGRAVAKSWELLLDEGSGLCGVVMLSAAEASVFLVGSGGCALGPPLPDSSEVVCRPIQQWDAGAIRSLAVATVYLMVRQ